jgi:hypothetical protein
MLLLFTSLTYAQLPEVVIGPGLGSGRTAYHQRFQRTLSSDTAYVLTGLYYVDSTFSITVQPGTVVFGDTGSALIISRGGKIFAQGSKSSPVVFTSNRAPGSRQPGDWGGILVLGKAPLNKVEPAIEGGIIGGTYGGTDPNDNSGVIRYTRIEFAGYRFQLNNETNGLTMGGVGAGTEIHHVQVSYGNDDGFEWFGGTVNAKYLVVFGGTDDEFDTDFGYAGKVQFAFGLRDPNYWDPTGESNGFESDNDGSATSTDVPYTSVTFSNITLVGPERTDALVGNLPGGNKFQYSALLRRSTKQSLYNSVLAGYPWGFRIRDVNTIAFGNNDSLQVRNVSVAASKSPTNGTSVHDSAQWPGVTAWFNTPAYSNIGSTPRNPSAVKLTDMSNLNNPNPVPASGSELIGSASFTNPRLGGLDVVTYRGAFDPTKPMSQQWSAGWTNFDPQYTSYSSTPILTSVGGESAVESVPTSFRLEQNYPNPFNPSTTIRFSIPVRGFVSLKVYTILGQEIATLVNADMPAGSFETTFDARGLSSGTYIYRLVSAAGAQTQKMLLIR